LNGNFNPSSPLHTTCAFEYGPSESLGTTVACAPEAGEGTSAIAATASIAGLTKNTTYYYRITAANGSHHENLRRGEIQTFTTLASSASASTSNPAAPATASDAAVSATASGGTGTVTVGHYGSNIGGPPLIQAGAGYIDVHVGAGSTFSKVEIVDCGVGSATTAWWFDPASGWRQASDQVYAPGRPSCITVVVTAATSPSLAQLAGTRFGFEANNPAPTALTQPATAVGVANATLNGAFNPNGRVFTECRFQYGTSAAYGASVPCGPESGVGTAPIQASAALGGLAARTAYHYRLVASNGESTSYGADQVVTTAANRERNEEHGILHEKVKVPSANISVVTFKGVKIILTVPTACVHNGLVRATLAIRIPSHRRKGKTVVVKIYKVVFKVATITKIELRKRLTEAPFRLRVVIRHPVPKTVYELTARAFIAVTHGPRRTKSLHVALETCP
jgi:hypothetical protein